MGLLDQVLGGVMGGGMAGGGRRGGRSPVVNALLIALAAKAAQHYMATRKQLPQSGGAAAGQPQPGGAAGGGLLGGLLGGLTGGLTGGGLGDLLEQFNRTGHGATAKSWVDPGQNQPIAPGELEAALGAENIDELAKETGMPRQALLSELAETLPDAVDELTPEGRLPTDEELGRYAALDRPG